MSPSVIVKAITLLYCCWLAGRVVDDGAAAEVSDGHLTPSSAVLSNYHVTD